MAQTNLMTFLKRHDIKRFKDFIRTSKRIDFTPADEVKFFQTADSPWIRIFLHKHWPTAQSERVLLDLPEGDLIKMACQKWGGPYEENITWAFEEGSSQACERVIDLISWPSRVSESGLLHRSDLHLFRKWLKKFHTLSEDAERALDENISLQTLKNEYINYQMKMYV